MILCALLWESIKSVFSIHLVLNIKIYIISKIIFIKISKLYYF